MAPVRPYTPADYPLISSWWNARSFPPIPPQFLPPTGFIVGDHAAGFLYSTDSGIAWMEWITTNPQSVKIDRDNALNSLIDALTVEAKRLGFSAVFTSVADSGLISRYARHGFGVTDTTMTNMVRVV